MKFPVRHAFAAFAATTALLATGAAAAQSSQAGPSAYAGASLGLYNKYDLDCQSGVKCDKSAKTGGKIYGGYMFDETFGVEAMGFGLKSGIGSLKNQANVLVPGSVNLRGLGVSGVAAYNAGPFTLKGRLGLAYTQAKSYAGVAEKKSSTRPLIGAGVSYALTEQIALNADWDRISAKYGSNKVKTHADMFSVGLSYKF
jgi:OOP family OmpA-OmpF porin